MRIFSIGAAAASALLIPALAQGASPFAGRWDFNITTPGGPRACWLGITEKDGKLDLWFQPGGGNVYQVKDFKVEGSHLTINLSRNQTWELDAAGGKLIWTGITRSVDLSSTHATTDEISHVLVPVLVKQGILAGASH